MKKEIFVDNVKRIAKCPICDTICKRHSKTERIVISLENNIRIQYGKFMCYECDKIFVQNNEKYGVLKGYHYSTVVINLVLYMYKEGNSLEEISIYIKKNYNFDIPPTTIFEWTKEK